MNFREICCWNWAKEFNYFIVQYSRQEGSLLIVLRCQTMEQLSIRSHPPPTSMTYPSYSMPLWKERSQTEGEYPATVDLSKLISATLFDLPKFVFPPNNNRQFSVLGFLTARAPSNPSCNENGNLLQLLSPGEYDQIALVRLLFPEYPPKTQMCSPYTTTVAAALGNCIEGIAFHFLLPKSKAQHAESRPFSSVPYCLPPMTKRVWSRMIAECAYLALIMSGRTSKEFSGSWHNLCMFTFKKRREMVPQRICASIVALELTLDQRSSIPPVMKPMEGVCNSAWQYRGMAMREATGMNADGVKPRTRP